MRFLFHFYDLHHRAGIQRSICELANALVTSGHEVIIVTNTSQDDVAYSLNSNVIIEKIQNPEPAISGLKAWLPKALWAFRQIYTLTKLIRINKPSLVVDHGTALGLIYPFSCLAGTPFVLQRHFPVSSFPKGRFLFRALSLISRSKTIVVLTESIANEMRSCGFRRVTVIQNLIPAEAKSTPFSKAEPRTGLLLGRAGNPQKGFDLFLEALALSKISGWHFRIVGPGVDMDPILTTLLQKYDLGEMVELLSATDDPYNLIRRSSCLVIPSRYEGLPMVALEALSIGRPILASNIDGLQELIVDGINGLLFPSEDISAISTCLQRICAHPLILEKLAAGTGMFIEPYQEEVIIGKWLRLIDALEDKRNIA